MAGGAAAVTSGDALCKEVVRLAQDLGLLTREQYRCARRIWGAERYIDVVATHPDSRRRLGLECKYQGTPGSAEEKIPAVIQDIAAWPIPGLVVFSGSGFSANIRSFLISSGRAVDPNPEPLNIRLFFGLDLPERPEQRSLPL